METTNKPKIIKSILYSILCFFIFVLTQILLASVILLLEAIISLIPVLGTLLNMLLSIRQETPMMFASVLSVIIAYLLTTFIQEKMMKDNPTKTLSRIILGILNIIWHVLLLISHFFILGEGFFEGNAFLYIVSLLYSFVFIFHND